MGKRVIFIFLMAVGILLSMEIHAQNSAKQDGMDSLKTTIAGNSASKDTLVKKNSSGDFFLVKLVKKIFGPKSDSPATKNSSADSLSKVQKPSGSKDSLSNARKDSSSNVPGTSKSNSQDSLKRKNVSKSKSNSGSSGTISVGYDFGIIPFAVNQNYPMGYYNTEGNFGVDLFKLPFDASFYYSDLHSVSGLNDYFHVSFDAQKYKERLDAQQGAKENEIKEQIANLVKERQVAFQKLYYLKSMKNPFNGGAQNKISPIETASLDSLEKDSLFKNPSFKAGGLHKPDSSVSVQNTDSLNHNSSGNPNNDSLGSRKTEDPSLLQKTAANADSTDHKIKEYESIISQYDKDIKALSTKLTVVKNARTEGNYDPYGNRFSSILSSVKKFEIGLCYPDYSTFLVSGEAIRGVNIELEKNERFFAFTYGKTVNTLLYSNNAVQNTLQNMRNLYNYFDFNDITSGRNIIAVKFGAGKTEGTHLFLGLLYGVGQTSYITDSLPVFNSAVQQEKNYVGEVDGKWVINSRNTIDIVYGKSSVHQSNEVLNYSEQGFNALFQKDRSNAALLRYTVKFPKTKTKFICTGRWVDPFFISYGVGFIRPDNLRYEIKMEQDISSKIKLTLSCRKDEDNLLALYSVTNVLETFGAKVTWKVTKRLTIRAGYNPVVQKIMYPEFGTHFTNVNNISNIMATWNPKIKHFNTAFNALYSYYNLSTDTSGLRFKNISLNNVSSFNNGLKNTISFSMFYSSTPDTITGNTTLYTEEITYAFKKGLSLSAGCKLAIGTIESRQFGYLLKIHLPLIKRFSCEISGEKLVLGDFYNSYNIEQIKKFPYYCSGKIIYNW